MDVIDFSLVMAYKAISKLVFISSPKLPSLNAEFRAFEIGSDAKMLPTSTEEVKIVAHPKDKKMLPKADGPCTSPLL